MKLTDQFCKQHIVVWGLKGLLLMKHGLKEAVVSLVFLRSWS